MVGKIIKIFLISLAIVGLSFLAAVQLFFQQTAVAVGEPIANDFSVAADPGIFGTSTDTESQPIINSLPLRTSLVFGGDAMLSRVVGQKMVKYHDFSWPFQKVKEIFSHADLAIINLESPFTLGSKSYLVPTGSFSFNTDPQTAAGLIDAGIDVVDLANNHFANQGQKGMLDTFTLLEQKDIAYVGAGKDLTVAHQGVILERNGIKFGFLGYGYPEDSSNAGVSRPGIANMDLSSAQADVQRLREQADLVIILIHDGGEYTNIPTSHQKEFARAMIAAGADLVVGHHPHWVQQVEIYQDKPIVYSLGNLVFDQMWSQETREGALLKVDFSGKQVSRLEFMPVIIKDYGQPEIITDQAQKNKVLQRMHLSGEVIELE